MIHRSTGRQRVPRVTVMGDALCDGPVAHRLSGVLSDRRYLQCFILARRTVHRDRPGPHQVVHEKLIGVAKSEDVPKFMSNDCFKVEALETTARTRELLNPV